MKKNELKNELDAILFDMLENQHTRGKKQIKRIIEGIFEEYGIRCYYGSRSWGLVFYGPVGVFVELNREGYIRSYSIQ